MNNSSIENAYYLQLLSRVKKGKQVFIAHNATVIGEVSLGDHASVWYGAVIRGDEDRIHIGSHSNIQDNAVLHVDHGVPLQLGTHCVVGHSAILHGCTIGDHTLIGMRATVMNRASVGRYCIIGAHTLITEGMEIPDYSLVLGSPGRIVKSLSHEYMEKMLKGVRVYEKEAMKYLQGEQN